MRTQLTKTLTYVKDGIHYIDILTTVYQFGKFYLSPSIISLKHNLLKMDLRARELIFKAFKENTDKY